MLRSICVGSWREQSKSLLAPHEVWRSVSAKLNVGAVQCQRQGDVSNMGKARQSQPQSPYYVVDGIPKRLKGHVAGLCRARLLQSFGLLGPAPATSY